MSYVIPVKSVVYLCEHWSYKEKYAELKAWTALDGQGENIITYIKNVDKTLVFVCGFESSAMDSLVLKNVRRFTLYGMDNCEKVEKPTPSAS